MPTDQKEEIRPIVRKKIVEHRDRKFFVRVNALDTEFVKGDLEALETDAERARQLGFQEKLYIHPAQVEICNRLFSPSTAR